MFEAAQPAGTFHPLPQLAPSPDKMRVLIVATILILALSLGHCFRVNDVFDTFEDFVETDRQSDNPEDRQFEDLNDNIPAVFAATLGASLLANVLFGGGGAPALNKIGMLKQISNGFYDITLDCKCGVETTARIIGGQDVDIVSFEILKAKV